MGEQRPPTPPREEYRLNPAVQARLVAQREQEVQAADRTRAFQIYILFPGLLLALVGFGMMAVSSDMTDALIGQTGASTILFGVWAMRKRIAAMFQ